MNLYLMRHADAGVPRENPLLDAKRGLVKEGKQQCMLMAGVLAGLKAQIDVIISSPLKRARQSAQFVGTEIGFDAPILTSPALAPDSDYAAFQQLIAEHVSREGVLVVGHNPNLHQFIAKLIANGNGNGPAASSEISITLCGATGSPAATKTAFAAALSIATADARTPECV